MDLCAGYWQCTLDPSYFHACGIIAPKGTFVSTWMLHCLKNASAYFQFTTPPLFDELSDAIKAWIDDSTIHAKTESELMHHIENFFAICSKQNLRLSAQKCSIYTKKAKWCKRTSDNEVYQLNSRNMKAFQNMKLPMNADELYQFIHCCQWMSSCVRDFHRMVPSLIKILEKAYLETGSEGKARQKT